MDATPSEKYVAADVALDFKSLFDAAPMPLVVLTPDLTIHEANSLYVKMVGERREALIGRGIFDAFPSSDPVNDEMLRASVAQVAANGTPDFLPLLHYPLAPSEGGDEQVERFWSCSHVPLFNRAGEVAFVLQQMQDVTEMHRGGHAQPDDAETSVIHRVERVQALNASLLAESAQLRNLFMRSPSFMCLLRGADYRFDLVNPAFTALVGDRELMGRLFREAIPEAEGQLYLDMLDKVYASGEAFVGKQMRAEFEQVAGEGPKEVFISFVFQPIFDDAGQVAGIFVDGNDVTDHVRAEKSQALLVRELHHRVRNTLATVQGVMNSTARTAETIEDYQWAFSGRISSLARTHALLTEEIQQFVSFPHLLRQEIGAYADGAPDRVILEGPDVELPSQLAVPLGMTIHELATNAYRHGALSVQDGRVTVAWTVVPAKDKRVLTCHWTESGGPTVSPPSRQGFGSMILTRVLSQQIGAKVDASYSPAGFELRADIPLVIERI